ncbi:MAG: hypothetical protein ACYCR9_05900, partial [Cuniculiplasma sp.]
MTREIKPIGGYEYVYESSMVWDSEHKKRHKVSKYMGKVMDGDRDNPKRVRDMVSIRGIYEIGHIELAWSVMDDVISALREEYPDDLMKIIAFSLNR